MNSKFTQLCRLCLESSAGLLNIFETFEDSTIASVLTQHFWFQITEDDGMPEWLCEKCWSQTKTFHQFYKRLQLLHSIIVVKDEDEEMEQERSGDGSVEKDLESELSIDKYDEETDIKIEDTQLLSKEGEEDGCLDEDNNDSSDQSETELTVADGPSLRMLRNDTKEEEQNAEIYKFFTMKCDICNDVDFKKLEEVGKHYRQVHKLARGHLMCCGKKYQSRHLMLDHVQYHVNPDAHHCDQCGNSYKDREALRRHMTYHARSDPFKCSLCPKVYKNPGMLKYHVRDKHPANTSKKFPCDQCGKIFKLSFNQGSYILIEETYRTQNAGPTSREIFDISCTSKTLLDSHVRNMHSAITDHVCELCGRTFRSKCTLQTHTKLEHSTQPLAKVQCDICGVWLRHKGRLSAHFRTHREMKKAQNGKTLNCPICKKVVKTKDLMSNHIRSTHSERKHKCSFCDKAFKVRINLREHEALHTGTFLYSCTYCDRTFKSNANMYSHRKKIHVEEWTRDREEKARSNQEGTTQ